MFLDSDGNFASKHLLAGRYEFWAILKVWNRMDTTRVGYDSLGSDDSWRR